MENKGKNTSTKEHTTIIDNLNFLKNFNGDLIKTFVKVYEIKQLLLNPHYSSEELDKSITDFIDGQIDVDVEQHNTTTINESFTDLIYKNRDLNKHIQELLEIIKNEIH